MNRFNAQDSTDSSLIEGVQSFSNFESKASPYFFCKDRAGFDGDRFNAVRLFRVISEDSAEEDSLDESSAFLIEGAHCELHT